MAPLLKSLGLDRFTLAERIELADALWDNIESERAGATLTKDQRDELDRRMTDYLAAPQDTADWPRVRDAAIKRLQP